MELHQGVRKGGAELHQKPGHPTGHKKVRADDSTAIALQYLQSPGLDEEPKSPITTSQCPVPNTT